MAESSSRIRGRAISPSTCGASSTRGSMAATASGPRAAAGISASPLERRAWCSAVPAPASTRPTLVRVRSASSWMDASFCRRPSPAAKPAPRESSPRPPRAPISQLSPAAASLRRERASGRRAPARARSPSTPWTPSSALSRQQMQQTRGGSTRVSPAREPVSRSSRPGTSTAAPTESGRTMWDQARSSSGRPGPSRRAHRGALAFRPPREAPRRTIRRPR